MTAQLGDARSGKLADNMLAFGRALRRAGVATDAARIALAQQAALLVGLNRRDDLGAALEAVLVSCEQDRLVFRELFDAFFRDPDLGQKLLSQMLPSAEGGSQPVRRPRVREALAPPRANPATNKAADPSQVEFDAAMSASQLQRLHNADFNALNASEYRLVQSLVRDIRLPIPCMATRRTRPGPRGSRIHWPGAMHLAAQTGGELLRLPRLQRREQPLPLLLLVDVSGSMERYARLLLAFVHAATRQQRQRQVFAFGTQLTDLGPAFAQADGDAMLAQASRLIQDFAGGTQLGAALQRLRLDHGRRLIGRRTLVLLISDGLDTGEPAELAQELAWLRRHSRRLLWLNPLLRFDGYAPLARGAAELNRHADAMLAVHNVESLQALASALARLLAR